MLRFAVALGLTAPAAGLFRMTLVAGPEANLTSPTFAEALPSGDLLVSDSAARHVQLVVGRDNSPVLPALMEVFAIDGALSMPSGLALSHDGRSLLLAEQNDRGIRKLHLDGLALRQDWIVTARGADSDS